MASENQVSLALADEAYKNLGAIPTSSFAIIYPSNSRYSSQACLSKALSHLLGLSIRSSSTTASSVLARRHV